jgi:type II secretory pathway pseudopilin PulG
MRARKPQLVFVHPQVPARSERGIQMVELLVAITIGSILMMAVFDSATAMYRASASGENQVIATNMAQQVIDNARNSTYSKLRDTLLAGNVTATQDLPLYEYPTNPTTSMFPRPLLRNLDMQSGGDAHDALKIAAKTFNGTVTEQLTNLTPAEMQNGMIRVDVFVRWKDTRGPHTYTTGTTISQTGIHN